MIDYKAIIYTSLILIYFIICFFIVLATRLENLFKQGSTWQIRLAQIFISLVVAYFLATATMTLINNFKIS